MAQDIRFRFHFRKFFEIATEVPFDKNISDPDYEQPSAHLGGLVTYKELSRPHDRYFRVADANRRANPAVIFLPSCLNLTKSQDSYYELRWV